MTPIPAVTSIENIVIVALPILSAATVLVMLIFTYHRRQMQRDDMEATLKMEMIQRGMSAEDIERVLAARIGTNLLGKARTAAYAGAMESVPPREG